MIDLNEIERLALAATPGPWKHRQKLADGTEHDDVISDERDRGAGDDWTIVVSGAGCDRCGGAAVMPEDAAYFAYLDPPRVLELVKRMRKLEIIAEVAEVTRTLCDYDAKSDHEDDEHTEDCSACELDRQLAALDSDKDTKSSKEQP